MREVSSWAGMGLRRGANDVSGVVIAGTPALPVAVAVNRRHLHAVGDLIATLREAAERVGHTIGRAGLVLDGFTSEERISLAGLCARYGFPMTGLRVEDLLDLARRYQVSPGDSMISCLAARCAADGLAPWAEPEREAALAGLAALDVLLDETSRGILPETVVRAYGPFEEDPES